MAPRVYIALSQFCDLDDRPRRMLLDAGFDLHENKSGRRLSHGEVIRELSGFDAVIAGLEPYDAETFTTLPMLKCVSRCGVGTDNIDLEAARRHTVTVLTTPDEVVEAVAELTIGMILSLARNFPQYQLDFRERVWRRRPAHLLSEWTVGLIGGGRIGRAVERHLRVFAPRILVYDPALQSSKFEAGTEFVAFDALLAEADLVSIHATQRPEDGPILDAKCIRKMKKGSRLVNTSRGYLVDEAALYEALKIGHLAGAALDVFQTEPYSGPLASLPQVLCTPHVATLTDASRRAMEFRAARNLAEYFRRP